MGKTKQEKYMKKSKKHIEKKLKSKKAYSKWLGTTKKKKNQYPDRLLGKGET